MSGIALGAAAGILACSSTSVAPISVRYRGPADYRPVSTSSVEVIRAGEERPCTPIADLEVASDGSTYEALVERLRQRAASLGADAICDVRSVYDVGAGHFSQDARTTPVRPEDQLMDAAKAGFSVFMNRPSWVSVRGTAVRLKDLHPEDQRPMGGAPESRPGQSDARESMPSESPASRPPQPQEKPPAEKP